MRAALVVSMQLAACGRLDFDRVATVDVDAAGADAVVVATGPWGTPVRVFAAFGPFDDPSLTADGLELFVNANTALMSSERQLTSEPWSDPVPLSGLAAASGTQPFVRRDGLELYYALFSGGMMVSRRDNRSAAWGAPVPATDLDALTANDLAQRADGLEAVISAGSPGVLSLVRRSSFTAPWVPSDTLDASNDGSDNREGCIAEYGLALYFGSMRAGSLDLYRAERMTVDDPFGPPFPIDELNTGAEESDPWVSEDGHTLYFTSDRDGDRQVWMATR